ncbi:MAG: hypothetical protein JWM72_3118 [Actinomycetia bacterium]|jgi:hypothetical protein|nr:hypothetical protein [Actinomycetes bacterium]MDQ1461716.1 hypothetical protein [Actinomycetota bacterium]
MAFPRVMESAERITQRDESACAVAEIAGVRSQPSVARWAIARRAALLRVKEFTQTRRAELGAGRGESATLSGANQDVGSG